MTNSDGIHVIVGGGPVGTALAKRLAEDGRRVRLLTRSGTNPNQVGVEALSLDASNAQELSAASRGASVIYNCANPGSYPSWARDWPPLAAAILKAAEKNDSVLVTASNIYGYGPVTGPITQNTPMHPSDTKGEIRLRMWEQALAAHRAGRVRVTEARASDYIGPTVPTSGGLLAMYARTSLLNQSARVFADPNQPHSWSFIDDVAATLQTLGQEEKAWGKAWLVPNNPPLSVRQVLDQMCDYCGVPRPKLNLVPRSLISVGGLFVPMLREVKGILYQFDQPLIVDGSETERVFGLQPTPWQTVVEQTGAAWYGRAMED